MSSAASSGAAASALVCPGMCLNLRLNAAFSLAADTRPLAPLGSATGMLASARTKR